MDDNIIVLDHVRIERKMTRKCTCKVRKFTVDTTNREITCSCGIIVDPFEAMVYIAKHYEQINEQHKSLKEQRELWIKEKPHSVLFKGLERSYQKGKMFPHCPNCDVPFDFKNITSFVNAEYFIKRKQAMSKK